MQLKQCPLSTYQNFCKKYNIKVTAPTGVKFKLQKSDFPPDESLKITWSITYDRETKKYKYYAAVEDREATYTNEITKFLMKELGSDLVTVYGMVSHLWIKKKYLNDLTEKKVEILKDVLYNITEPHVEHIVYLFILENIEQYKKFLASNKLNTNDSSNRT